MAKILVVTGSKGGSGKTTVAHLVAHGCGSFARPIQTVVITTDPGETPRKDRRRYAVLDGRSKESLATHLRKVTQVERLLVVVDGAAARPELDRVVAELADGAILPFMPSDQDVERAQADLARMPRAMALPCRWPVHPGTVKRVRGLLDRAAPEERRLAPFPHIPRLSELLGDGYPDMAYMIASPARNLALEVLASAGIDPDDIALLQPRDTAMARHRDGAPLEGAA